MGNEIVDAIASPAIPAIAQPPTYAPAYEVVLDFVSSVIGSIAWPLVVIGVAFLFREQIIAMVENVESVKVGGVEAKIRRGLKVVEEELKATEPVTAEVAALNSGNFERLMAITEVSPTGAIVDAFKAVEEVAHQLVVRELPRLREPQDGRRMHPMSLHKHLLSLDVVPRNEINTFQKLRELRNRAAHAAEDEITSQTAREYVRLADRFVDVLNQVLMAPEIQPDMFKRD